MSFPDVLLMRDRDRFVAYMVEADLAGEGADPDEALNNLGDEMIAFAAFVVSRPESAVPRAPGAIRTAFSRGIPAFSLSLYPGEIRVGLSPTWDRSRDPWYLRRIETARQTPPGASMLQAGVWACDDVKSCFLGVRS